LRTYRRRSRRFQFLVCPSGRPSSSLWIYPRADTRRTLTVSDHCSYGAKTSRPWKVFEASSWQRSCRQMAGPATLPLALRGRCPDRQRTVRRSPRQFPDALCLLLDRLPQCDSSLRKVSDEDNRAKAPALTSGRDVMSDINESHILNLELTRITPFICAG